MRDLKTENGKVVMKKIGNNRFTMEQDNVRFVFAFVTVKGDEKESIVILDKIDLVPKAPAVHKESMFAGSVKAAAKAAENVVDLDPANDTSSLQIN